MKIGSFSFDQPVALAPMAGVSDRPLRVLARRFGADYAVTEMVCAETRLWHSRKTRPRLDMDGEAAPRIVQIAGGEPRLLAEAARAAVDLGADVVDINMGCPAKKVLDAHAGSALLRDEALVGAILDAVVAAAGVPVTLKMRTGWSPERRNGVAVARLAERAGIAALTVHGRTRACAFRGHAEYATIAAIKQAVGIPVIANGDITTPAEAREVLAATGADGLMIGRAARGRPWLFGAVRAALAGRAWQPPSTAARLAVMREHLAALHAHYGIDSGLRIARKHLGWYLEGFAGGAAWRQRFVRLEHAAEQFALLDELAGAPAWCDAA